MAHQGYANGHSTTTEESAELKPSHQNGYQDHKGFDAHHGSHGSNGAPLTRETTNVTLTPAQFEALYLSPQNKKDLGTTFGNPTPVGLGGFVLALTPLVMQFMGWRGTAAVNGIPTVGTYIFLGGLLAILASIGEFIIGNTFPSIFFGTYGGFFLVYGITLIPSTGAVTAFADPTAITSEMNDVQALGAAFQSGAMSPQFNNAIAFLASMMTLLTFIHLIASVRTNIVFVLAFATLLPAFALFAASRFAGARGDLLTYEHYQEAAGACGFATCMFGWYLFAALVLASVDFPIALPVFDLSGKVPGASDLAKKKKDAERGIERY